jgi:hypothetical protein
MRHCTTLLFTFAAALSLASQTRAALVVNPALPITHRVSVQIIQTALDNGSSPANVFGDPTRQAAIEANIDTIWSQAGIDVEFLPNVVRYNNTFTYQGLLPTGIRPINDLDIILTNAELQGGILNPDPSVINMFFVNVVPGFDLKPQTWSNGAGKVGGNGIAVFVGSSVSAEHAAHWVSHEIGHNLGLKHTPSGVANLMGTSRNTELLTPEQIEAILQTQTRDDAVAFIPQGGTGFPVVIPPPMAGDYDRNGKVEATDYLVWRRSLNSNANLAADGNGNGVVDNDDFTVWKRNFGRTVGAAATAVSAGNVGVPEPGTLTLILTCVALATIARQRLRCGQTVEVGQPFQADVQRLMSG